MRVSRILHNLLLRKAQSSPQQSAFTDAVSANAEHRMRREGGTGDAEGLGTLYTSNDESVFDRLLWRMEHMCVSILATGTTVAVRFALLKCACLRFSAVYKTHFFLAFHLAAETP